ncbi:GTP-binding protein [Herbaspirillum sp. LeCh32-8]|uniref:CobW family GTP-binding protein n=1 Tax=Herbaspirillum sp. LeCh32-8 TaxID=2821356 RepID=UPI001AE594DD|nr:GTP-binding protein [Herbaspirillum sp. LeCh32-8]MBP0599424.1 GTP-binding protein [Herbaspirillum sp. LeCh32-8]
MSSSQNLPPALPPIPVTVVTGFLGTGKTTLLRGLVRRRQARRLALLINEFGEVAIDGALLRADEDAQGQVQIQDLSHGLIAYGDDAQFVPAMLALAARRAQIDHVLIETSGLALPSAVMEVLQSEQLAPHFVLDATLAVVDTPLLLEGAFDAGVDALAATALLFRQQLECADVVVLNKIDGLQEPELLQAEQRVRALAPNVRFLELAYDARLDIRLALGLRLHQAGAAVHHHYTPMGMPGERATVAADQGRFNGHAHSGLGAHSHGLATHKHFHEQDPGWLSFTLRSDAPQDGERLREAVAAASQAEPILRAKGFVQAGADAPALLVQGVRARVAVVNDDGEPGKTPARSELVFIGYHPSRTRVAQLLCEMTGTEWK